MQTEHELAQLWTRQMREMGAENVRQRLYAQATAIPGGMNDRVHIDWLGEPSEAALAEGRAARRPTAGFVRNWLREHDEARETRERRTASAVLWTLLIAGFTLAATVFFGVTGL